MNLSIKATLLLLDYIRSDYAEQDENIINIKYNYFFRAKISHKNFGDQLINKVLLNYLRRYGILVVDDREVPSWYCDQLNLKDTERLSNYSKTFYPFIIKIFLKNLIPKRRNRKIFYIKTPGSYQGKISNLKLRIKDYTYHLIYSLIGVNVCCFGISIGPFSKNRRLLEKLIGNSMFFTQ